mmetsp:Transcript_11023/g.19944  ORF Transcript_11023/g.19944 Transcript_11023/m.19944 type:complete len:320 (+) Transcript_11023:208-1167(+)|eukprot:CAMPEP_0182496526 /NCGR_PEP_ID=MMETSP1321-20130603/5154_1 /TAXON_ID=91990 /ORGANISM="Bolidomonas sp., Strain RCC1657" /LENGTH=319 /DNA_ID=CAMNT_0024700167 /DNA_START=140 /DNA_END=1099 /DNA_ORIENTATION=+
MPLIGQDTLDEYQCKLDALNAKDTPQRDRTLALMQSPDENHLYEKEERRKEDMRKKKAPIGGGGRASHDSHDSHDIESGRRGSKDHSHHHGGARRGSHDKKHSPRRLSHDHGEPHPNAHTEAKKARRKSSSSTSPKGGKLKPLKKKGSFGLGGLISEGSWNNFLSMATKKHAKIAPKTGANASTPYDIHDMHGKTGAEMNEDGDYFTEDAKKAGVGSKFVKPKFGKGQSTGYFISGDSEASQEREACIQVTLAILFLLGFFGLIGYMMYYFFRDTTLFSTQFFFLVALGMSLTICVYNLYSRGWNIFEMLGGRRGGSGG